jgi:two-component system, sensor histidine kinase and response regulator
LDNAISPLKDELKSQNIKIDINGNNLICMNIVYEEIKHIFSKLLQFSLINFKYNIKSDNYINLTIEENHDSIYITYEDNSKIYEDDKINRLFDIPLNIQNHTFDLGFYLIKVFVEKNFGLLLVKKTEDGIRYIIRFDK